MMHLNNTGKTSKIKMAVKESKNVSLNITAGIHIIITAFIISPWDYIRPALNQVNQ